MSTQTLKIAPMISKGTKCYLYFDVATTKNVIAGGLDIEVKLESDTSMFSKTSCANGTNNGSNCTDNGETQGIYEAEDDDGTSYYYRGSVDNNYVKFVGFYWRIIRINGNGSIRMIYSGSVADVDAAGKEMVLANGYNDSSTLYTQTQTSDFNSSASDNMYVGFMYTIGSVHGLGTSSTIKGILDTWYTNNLASYASYIDATVGFCGDRIPYTDEAGTTSGGGTGTTETYYGGYIRLYTNTSPDLKCSESSDLYTTSSSSKGNKSLTNPIGLITADEVALAGGVYGTNNYGYYLYTGNSYWTLSPSWFYYGFAWVFHVYTNGQLNHISANIPAGARPVINLKSGTLTKGSGTISDPYTV